MTQQTADASVDQEQRSTASTGERRLSMSYEEFLQWSDEDTHAEWVDGEVIIFVPPDDKHQALTGFIYRLISLFVDLFRLGAVRVAPLEMRLEAANVSREPDILFVAREHQERLTAERLNGPADLVVELVSNSSVSRDRTDKFYQYQAAGIREYWLIDPRPGKQRVDLYWLAEPGKYQPIPPDAEGCYHSRVLQGFWLREAWLWQEPLPNPLHILQSLSPEVKQAFRRSLDEHE